MMYWLVFYTFIKVIQFGICGVTAILAAQDWSHGNWKWLTWNVVLTMVNLNNFRDGLELSKGDIRLRVTTKQ